MRIKKPKLRELGEAIRALFTGPFTTRFPAEQLEIPPNFRGMAKYHEEDCIGCCACAEVCPADAIRVIDDVNADPPTRRLELHYDQCIFCGQCELNCTTNDGKKAGIQLSQEYDTACFDRHQAIEAVEKELLLCESCGVVVTTRQHLEWVAERLGTQRFANPNLIIASDEKLGLSAPQRRALKGGPVQRADLVRILCNQCRRAVLTREVYGQ
jgi:hydrogenase-4 component H